VLDRNSRLKLPMSITFVYKLFCNIVYFRIFLINIDVIYYFYKHLSDNLWANYTLYPNIDTFLAFWCLYMLVDFKSLPVCGTDWTTSEKIAKIWILYFSIYSCILYRYCIKSTPDAQTTLPMFKQISRLPNASFRRLR